MSQTAHEPVQEVILVGHREKSTEQAPSGFTAVNGRFSPQEYQTGNGAPREHSHPPMSRTVESMPEEQKPPVWQLANGDHHSNRATPPDSYRSAATSPGKRKRVETDEDESGSGISPTTPPTTSSGEPRRRMSTMDSGTGQESPASQRPPQHIDNRDQSWYSRPTTESYDADAQLAESLKRETQRADMEHSSPEDDGDEHSMSQANGDFNGMETTRVGVQVDPKKRKRVFSNRTKTGCQTCRKRKKKCDEAKPECNNCLRGGFICEGYANKSAWAKPSSFNRGPAPLQARQSLPEQASQTQLYQRPPPDAYDQRSQPQVDGGSGRPIVVDEPDHRHRNSWSNAWPEPNHSRPRSQDYSRPPQQDHGRHPHQQQPPQHQNGYPPQYHNHSQQPPPQRTQAQPSYGQNLAPMHHSSSPAMTAQLALQHHTQQIQRPPPAPAPAPPPPTEKEKMLTGEPYYQFSDQLLDEREQCKTSVCRFNNAANPLNGMSREERRRLFHAIVEPHANGKPVHITPSNPVGSIGERVIVDAPFNCEYGYNLNIGNHVHIEANCTIQDPCKVKIGARTIIGPNCTIVGKKYPEEAKVRKGSEGQVSGVEIEIQEDVLIGANVTIFCRKPDERVLVIGRGSIIEPGTVINETVKSYTIMTSKPAELLGGIPPYQPKASHN